MRRSANEARMLPAPVPFTILNNHVYVDVRLNGKGPFHFIFDTGGANLMDPAVAEEIGARVRGSTRIDGVGNASQAAQLAGVDSVRIGDAELTHQRFIVTPSRAAFGAAEGPSVDGLVGAEFLARYVTSIDYERRELRFTDDAAAAGPDVQVLPLTVRAGHPRVPCRVAAVAAVCAIDTGSRLDVSVLKKFAGEHPDIVPAQLTAVGVDGYGIGGAAYGQLGRITSIALGSFAVQNVVADFSTQERGAFADATVGLNVGGGILRRFTLTLDYPHLRVMLRPNAAFTQPENADRSGLFLIARSGAVTVLDARPGTPAALAGIAKDDTIAAAAGRRYEPAELPDLRALLAGPAGTVVRLRVESGDRARDVALVLRDYI
ncbi:MAG: aspartyl protease family protein [Candidatus Velthaea sp.]